MHNIVYGTADDCRDKCAASTLIVTMRECKFSLKKNNSRVSFSFHSLVYTLAFVALGEMMRRVCNSPLFSVAVVTFLIFGNNVLVRQTNCQNTTDIRLSTNVRPFNYEIHIKVDIVKREFTGVETIHVQVYDESTDLIELHVLDLEIESLRILHNDSDVEVAIMPTEYFEETEKLLIKFSENLALGSSYRIHVEFKGKLKNDMKGLYISSYYDNNFFLR